MCDISLEAQNRIRNLVVEKSGANECAINGAGCDSGDPVEFTLTEISQGFNVMIDEVVASQEEVADLKKELAEANDKIRRFNNMRW